MQIKLTPRLEKIANLVKSNHSVADIGTDHGYIAIYLIQNSISPYVIAGDINKKPLESARNNIKEMGLSQRIETRLGSGLSVIKPGEVETVIIAGMGGILIGQLLQEAPEIIATTKEFILQPMQAQEELRRYLVDNGFKIVKDVLVKEDHRIYEIICAEKGQQEVIQEIQYEIGFYIDENPRDLAIEFVEGRINIYRNIIADIKDIAGERINEKLGHCKQRLEALEEVLICLKK